MKSAFIFPLEVAHKSASEKQDRGDYDKINIQ